MGRKIIAMSLYGNAPQYTLGAVANAKLMPLVYPDWTLRIYYNTLKGIPEIAQLKELGCELVPQRPSRGQAGMFWRFLAAWGANTERVIFRDSDSRINHKEAAAVQAWEALGHDAHCMHDHMHHRSHPLFGGMWGVKFGVLPRELRREALRLGRQRQPRVADMRWLARKVLPKIKKSLLRHSSIPVRWPSVPFPDHAPMEGFIGQQYDEFNQPIDPLKSAGV